MSFLCSLPLVAALFADYAAPAPFATGYVEGEYTLAEAEVARISAELSVARLPARPQAILQAEAAVKGPRPSAKARSWAFSAPTVRARPPRSG